LMFSGRSARVFRIYLDTEKLADLTEGSPRAAYSSETAPRTCRHKPGI
jgi:hypothetical protein